MSEEWEPDQTVRVPSAPDGFKPYRHQLAAWDRMTAHFDQRSEGMLVIPTGGGKTAVAARWLLRNHVANGGRVLWFAHRRSLLRQAARTFERAAGDATPKDTLSRIVISGADAGWSQVTDHDVVLSSVQSAASERNIGFVHLMREKSPQGLFVVVDEAHHAAAPSYQRVLKMLMDMDCKVLGLSATPVRIQEDDQRRLWNIFRHKVYDVSIKELINEGILARPAVETVNTNIEFEREFTEKDLEHLARFGELGEEVLGRIASHSARNQKIVEHYANNRSKYGKTIVFAVDTLHASTLVAEFTAQGVAADYVDYTRGDEIHDVIASYRDADEPVVLTNVEMLTEGVDLPRTKTIFIVRPTRSAALLAQMVGRALRGRAAGGNEQAHLVTFVDTWQDFSVLDAEYVVETGLVAEAETPEHLPWQFVPIERALVSETYKLVRSNVRGDFAGIYQCLPHGWLMWEAETDDEILHRQIMVFDNQATGFDALIRDFTGSDAIPADLDEPKAKQIIRNYWGDCQDPLPSWLDVLELLRALRDRVEVRSFTFEDKKKFDPATVARDIWEKDLGERAKGEHIQRVFDADEVCKLVYRGDVRTFREDVQRELDDMHGRPAQPPPEVVEKVPKELASWPEGDAGYDLTRLLRTVLDQPRLFPRGAPRVGDIRWLQRPSRSKFGFCRYSDMRIFINPLLNSPDVPRFVMEYLVYHEALMPTCRPRGTTGTFASGSVRSFRLTKLPNRHGRWASLRPVRTTAGASSVTSISIPSR